MDNNSHRMDDDTCVGLISTIIGVYVNVINHLRQISSEPPNIVLFRFCEIVNSESNLLTRLSASIT